MLWKLMPLPMMSTPSSRRGASARPTARCACATHITAEHPRPTHPWTTAGVPYTALRDLRTRDREVIAASRHAPMVPTRGLTGARRREDRLAHLRVQGVDQGKHHHRHIPLGEQRLQRHEGAMIQAPLLLLGSLDASTPAAVPALQNFSVRIRPIICRKSLYTWRTLLR